MIGKRQTALRKRLTAAIPWACGRWDKVTFTASVYSGTKKGGRPLSKAAGMNLAAAYSALAQCYRYGAGVTEDKAAAVEMYKQAFALGQGLAADEIGTMYLVGNEILPNVAEAFRWYEKGAEMEEAASWYHLGICYAEGLGTEINRDKALEYLYRAYAAEYPGALEYITDNMQIRLQ